MLLIGKSGVIKKDEDIDVEEEEKDDKGKKESVKDLAEESLEKRKSSRSGAVAREELSRTGAAARRPNTPDDKVSFYLYIYTCICMYLCILLYGFLSVYKSVYPSMCLSCVYLSI